MSPHPKRRGNAFVLFISGLIIEKLIDDESSKEDPTSSTNDKYIKGDKDESLHESDKQETLNQLPQD